MTEDNEPINRTKKESQPQILPVKNTHKAVLKEKSASLTKELVKKIGTGKNAKRVYEGLDEHIKGAISEGAFIRSLQRLAKAPVEEINSIRDPEMTLSLKISQSQLLVQNILKILPKEKDGEGKDKNFFDRAFLNSETIEITAPDEHAEIKEYLATLDSKLDYVTDCVDFEYRKSVPRRSSELAYIIAMQEKLLRETNNRIENIETADDNSIFQHFLFVYANSAQFRKNSQITKTAVTIAAKDFADPKNPNRTLFVYIALGIAIFIKLLIQFVSAYEKRRRNKYHSILPEEWKKKVKSTALVIGDYNIFNIEKCVEEEDTLLDTLEEIENNIFQILDVERLNIKTFTIADCKKICEKMHPIFDHNSDIFFNEKMIIDEECRTFFENVLGFRVWDEKDAEIKYLRLFISEDRKKAIKEAAEWTEEFIENLMDD